MDFFKRICKELCDKLILDGFSDKKSLGDFINKKCKKYGQFSIEEEKEILNPIYDALKLKKSSREEYLRKLKDALDKLGEATNMKFFSIFLGIGTGKYYRDAAKRIENKINKLEQNNMFRGLPNRIFQNCCYINSALQQLYTISSFKDKVITFDTSNIVHPNDDQKKLIAVQKIFKHLSSPNETLKSTELDNLMKDLGHKRK